uniref:Agenet domain-containing protein n=1 Tax=Nelumbo nucifera TaxID=4432 RepID=A0A822YFV4_NELNU|nr:TPA_asm: hypothetical protein HUJ06_011905 [Nelumbo nucifera]
MAETQFPRGALIEVCCDDDGFRGAWFEATVLRSVTRRQNKPQLYIEYSHLVQEQDQSKPLKEFVNVVNARPRPPRDIDPTFKLSEEVDAFHNDAWWEGIVTQVLDNSRYSVFFRGTKEQIEFGKNDLRRHREWIDGSWNPPKEVQSSKTLFSFHSSLLLSSSWVHRQLFQLSSNFC